MTLAALLDRAEKAPKRFTDVEAILDTTVVDRLEELDTEHGQVLADLEQIETDLDDEIAAIEGDLRNSDPRPAKLRKAAADKAKMLQPRADELAKQIEELNESIADDLITFRFTALDGWEWSEIAAHSVPRDGVAEDAGRAYNMDEVCKIAARRTGVILNPDGSTSPVSGDEWDRLWKIAPAATLFQIKYQIWYINEFRNDAAREAALNAARKASAARAAGPTSPSRSDSESPRVA